MANHDLVQKSVAEWRKFTRKVEIKGEARGVEIRSSQNPADGIGHIEERRVILLRLVNEPEPGVIPVFKRMSGGNVPLLRGGGLETLLCGNCDQELAVAVDREELPRLIFRCPGCGYFNDTD